MTLQSTIADYVLSIARWRRQRAEEYDRDPRNLISAAGLEGFAEYVRALPDDDPCLQELTHWLTPSELFEPGQRVHVAISRFHYFQSDATYEGFMQYLDELSREDRNEHGRFGGTLPEGDDPWANRWDPGTRQSTPPGSG
jgi:hypothetical protein